ncbi:hypothetical protein JD969_15585 [Planctomycetota bacterium]|nr:hypothetical protein JD969_15585 [Planctomycetota bacterium]
MMKINTNSFIRAFTILAATAITIPLVGCTSGFAFQKRAVQADHQPSTIIVDQPTMAAHDRADMITNEMDKICKLTPKQREMIEHINMECAEKCDQIADNTHLSREQTEHALSRNWHLKDTKYRSVLSPKQYMAWYEYSHDMYNKTSPMVKKHMPEATKNASVAKNIAVHATALD